MPKNTKGYRRQYRKGRSRAIKQLERNATNAIMSGKILVDDADGDGFVYVIRLGMGNLYKIGCSIDVKARMKSLMASNPHLSLTFALKVKSRHAFERALHTKFAEWELFELDDSRLNELAACFPNAERLLDHSSLRVRGRPRVANGNRRCSHCGIEFTPLKSYWRLCDNCLRGSDNKTQGGWSRWRNLRTETHEYGKG